MKDGTRIAWSIFGGMILGAMTASAIGRGKLRPCAAKWLSYTYDMKDKVVAGCESLKEDCEDIAAEAKEQAEIRRAAKQAKANVVEEEIVEVDVKEGK